MSFNQNLSFNVVLDFSSLDLSSDPLLSAAKFLCFLMENPQPGGAGVAFQLARAPAVQPGLFKPAGTEAPTDAALTSYQSYHQVCSMHYGGKGGSRGQILHHFSKCFLLNS